MNEPITRKITVTGMVQGVGYRPFVAELAEEMGITGTVRNCAGIVTITASGIRPAVAAFEQRLRTQMPPGASVGQIISQETGYRAYQDFMIADSSSGNAGGIPLIAPDLPMCRHCKRHLNDPSDRRYRYPLISCAACGPRYSIIKELPYDRDNTAMVEFELCEVCRTEYNQRGNIRRYAQTISCPVCGPKLFYVPIDRPAQEDGSFSPAEQNAREQYVQGEQALSQAVLTLKNGGIAAVKDIGGFHLACSPFRRETVSLLRQIKYRAGKPLAVMFSDLDQVKQYGILNESEEALLLSPARPIVLVKRRHLPAGEFAAGVCRNSPDIGAMLPGNPLQELLAAACGPFVMTSANRSGGPMITGNGEMTAWMNEAWEMKEQLGIDMRFGVLMHERTILTPLDDSVMRVISGRMQVLRRARGMVPDPILLPAEISGQTFCAGGDLKACFCYTAGNKAYLSQQFGDIQEEAVGDLYRREKVRMQTLFGFKPDTFVCDAHPGYLTAAAAGEYQQVRKVLHHHAHIAAVIAEHGLEGTIIGAAFDGTGWGSDGSVWGSEFFRCQNRQMQHTAGLKPVRLIGGDEGTKNARLILYGYLTAHFRSKAAETAAAIPWLSRLECQTAAAAIENNIHTVTSSSMGRLFDAVSALLGICPYSRYEGEAAVELEYAAAAAAYSYGMRIAVTQENDRLTGDTYPLFCRMLEGLRTQIPPACLAKGFIDAVSCFVEEVCCAIRTGIRSPAAKQVKVALSGGTFLNRLLTEQTVLRLEQRGFTVFLNEQVPPGDGGICLGQAYLCEK